MLQTAKRLGFDTGELESLGILLDPGVENMEEGEDPKDAQEKYLCQALTRPVLPDDRRTFFFELIQRGEKAIGFGEYNVIALWKALQADKTPTPASA